jgi:hypothetical protein
MKCVGKETHTNMSKKYQVTLTPSERDELLTLIRVGTVPASALSHARILLKADVAPGGPAWKDERISDAFEVSVRTVVRVRQAFVYTGLRGTIYRKKPTGPRSHKLDGELEAHLIALVCSPAPPGRARWSMRLLSDEFVKLQEVSELGLHSISRETIRQTLKKTKLSPGSENNGVCLQQHTQDL